MRRLHLILIAMLGLSSCNAISSFIHDDQVVARVGKTKLYRSQVEMYIPDLVSPEDSANLAMQFINTWASELLYLQKAEEKLSKAEMDVTPELEEYRKSLLKYRFEQRFINERLDTLITDEQVLAYYKAHTDNFDLVRPILKVRFVDVMRNSPNKDLILKMMSSDEYEDFSLADSLAYSSALRYFDSSDTWMDAQAVAKEFSMGYEEMLSHLDGDFIKVEPEDRDDILVAYVCDIMKSGTAPVEFCASHIRDVILSDRKHSLVKSLEQDLLTDAIDRKHFVIY